MTYFMEFRWINSETICWRTGGADRQTDEEYDNGKSCQERMITPEDGNLTLAYRLSTALTIL